MTQVRFIARKPFFTEEEVVKAYAEKEKQMNKKETMTLVKFGRRLPVFTEDDVKKAFKKYDREVPSKNKTK